MTRKKGIFITLEGTDGVGKSTQAKLLKTWLENQGRRVTLTREPGGGEAAEKIRSLLLDPKIKLANLTELFLYQAARIEHMEDVIRPALKKGHVVICDRFTDATIAYQGFGRGLPVRQIVELNGVATGGISPQLTLFLDLPVRNGLKNARRRAGNGHGDRIEKEGLAFQTRVRKGYLMLARTAPRRIVRVEVEPSIVATQTKIQTVVQKKLGL